MSSDRVDLRQLRYFVAVAEERHLGRASARLLVAQPALSRQIKDLEDELDVVLFDRGARGVELTPAGATLKVAAAGLLDEVSAALDRVRRAAAGLEGRLVLGASRPTMWREFLPRALDAVRAELPHVTVEVREAEAGPILWDGVRSGELDIGLGTPPSSLAGLKSEPMFDSSFDCALLPASHPLAARKSLAPGELSRLPLLWSVPEVHPSLLAAVLDEMERLAINSAREMVYSGPHAVWIAVASGRGWSPVNHAMRDWAPDGTVAVPVDGLRVPLVNAAFWRSDDGRSQLRLVLAALRRFRDTQRRGKPPRASVEQRRSPEEPGKPGLPPGLALRHLRASAALHGGGSFGQAAHQLGITQPALSRQIRDLEREVGAALCERTVRGVQNTEAGEALAADAGRILQQVDDLRAEMVRARRLQQQQVIVGAIETAGGNPRMLQLVRTCLERHPGLQLLIQERLAGDLVAALENGAVDLAVVPLGIAEGHEEQVERFTLTTDRIDCALVPASHRLARRERLTRDELSALPFLLVMPDTSPDFYRRAMEISEAAKIRISSVLTFDSVQTVWAHVAQGRGWSFGINRHRTLPPAGCVAVPVEGLSLPWGLELLWRRGERIPAIQNVLAVARELAGVTEKVKRKSGEAAAR